MRDDDIRPRRTKTRRATPRGEVARHRDLFVDHWSSNDLFISSSSFGCPSLDVISTDDDDESN